MLKKLLTLLLSISPWSVMANYHNNQLYIALKPATAAEMIDKEGSVDHGMLLKEFASILGNAEISKVRVPFFKARNSPLQFVLHLEFSAPVENLITQCRMFTLHPGVAYAEQVPEVRFFDSYIPNDLGPDTYEGQWYLHKIQAPEAWSIARGSRDITVAVVDQAVDLEHPDLQAVIWTNPGEIPDNGIDDDGNGYVDDVHGYDVAEDDHDPRPDHPGQTHGTHVAGLVSAKSDNSIGIASIGFDLSLIPVKCAFSDGSGATQYEGVVYAANAGADIISCSWGGYSYSTTYKNVIEFAQAQGCLVVCSAGNDAQDVLAYPGAYSGVISVGATTKLDRMATFTNYNEQLSVSAPGYEIVSTLPGNQYQAISGTSMSTPIVSGLLGLMKSHHPKISNDELKTCLLSTTDPVNVHHNRYDGKTGTGRINAYKAMQCVNNLKGGASNIVDAQSDNDLKVYPNPVNGNVNILLPPSGDGGHVIIRISDITGNRIYHDDYLLDRRTTVPLTINTGKWAPGMYLVEFRDGERLRRAKFIVK